VPSLAGYEFPADYLFSMSMRYQPSSIQPEHGDTERHKLQCLFLERLHRLVDLNECWSPEWSAAERRMLEHALYSTYHDCVRVGLRPIARAMITLQSNG
jgi:hypothetical protein